MSERWPGGIVRSTPVTPTGPLQNGTAPGIWTMEQAAYWTKQGLWPTAGNFLAVEDVFSTWLYTGNGSTQTITNGINLSGQGGMVWIKQRDSGAASFLQANYGHGLTDTVRGAGSMLVSNSTTAAVNSSTNLISGFNSNGFGLGGWANSGGSSSFVSWTFREAANFFDVVTYTGNGSAARAISHSLGVAPGSMFIKRTDSTGQWVVYHRSLGNANALVLESTSAQFSTNTFGYTTPDATTFTVGDYNNINGATYVAYLYAHDTSSTGIIQCGSYAGTNAAGNTVTLGWEPQWVLIKNTTNAQFWGIYDNMRGMPVGSNDALLVPNSSGAEQSYEAIQPTATGFQLMNGNQDTNASGNTYIYIAIRRGPMRTPTLGTTVFSPNAISSGQPAGTKVTTNFPVDVVINTPRSGDNKEILTRLTASNTSASSIGLLTNTSDPETNRSPSRGYGWDSNVSLTLGGAYTDFGGNNNIQWNFRRAPSFFDVVCYTGTGSATTFNHNLGVAPELMLVKQRNSANDWPVYGAALPNANTNRLILNGTQAATVNSNLLWNSTSPTSTVFSVGTSTAVNGSGSTYVAYLFASAPGVSKVGSYTGNGSSQTIDCAFTTGARFVMIKRTDSTGDWYVWDSARGIVAANDPYLALNNTNAEVTTNDSVDTDNSGFIVNQVAASNVNVNGATYIFLAVA